MLKSQYHDDVSERESFFRMNPNAEHALFPHWFRILDTIMSWAMIVVFVRTEKHNNNIALHTRT